MRFSTCSSLLLLAALLSLLANSVNAAPPYVGRSVQAVVDELRAAGLGLAYSSNLLPSSLVVEREPAAGEPLAIAREILAAHGLGLREAGGTWLVVRGEPAAPVPVPAALPGSVVITATVAESGAAAVDGTVQVDPPNGPSTTLRGGTASIDGLLAGRHVLSVRAADFLPERVAVDVVAGQAATVAVDLVAAVPKLEELTVTASRYDVRNEISPSSTYFSRDQIESLSELGDDALRAAHRLPGVASNEFSSRSHVRGGAADEMTVIFDGIRLVEPYHLRDYQSVFSAVDQRVVSGLQVFSGGFPVEYGDSLSGLTIIEPREPTELQHEIGVSLLYTSLLSSGTFRDGKSTWLLSARRGNVDRLLERRLGKPSYRDGFVHVSTTLGDKHRLSFNDLGFDDDIQLTPADSLGHREQGRSETDTNQWWLKLESDWTSSLSSRTLLYSTHFRGDRTGLIDDVDSLIGAVDDRRELDASGAKQDWRYDYSDRQLWSFGFDAERVDGRYDYASTAQQIGVLATLGGNAVPARNYSLAPEGSVFGVYLADRWRLSDRWIADLGLRWDRETYLPPKDDTQWSPRASFLYRLGARTDLRFSLGGFYQAEGVLDLQVEDGVTEFAAAQNASHSIVGLEHRVSRAVTVRVEAFRKWTTTARPRFENLYDPLVLLPELRPGRVRIAPDRAESRGVEVLLNVEQPIAWWVGYSFSYAEDVIALESIPRSWDQRHAASTGVTWPVGPWTLSGTFGIHTGWPVTELALDNTGPTPVVRAGERNGERLDVFRRVDFRASKTTQLRVGSLRYFAELTNLTDRANACCLTYDVVTPPTGGVALERVERGSVPLTANFGLLWAF